MLAYLPWLLSLILFWSASFIFSVILFSIEELQGTHHPRPSGIDSFKAYVILASVDLEKQLLDLFPRRP